MYILRSQEKEVKTGATPKARFGAEPLVERSLKVEEPGCESSCGEVAPKAAIMERGFSFGERMSRFVTALFEFHDPMMAIVIFFQKVRGLSKSKSYVEKKIDTFEEMYHLKTTYGMVVRGIDDLKKHGKDSGEHHYNMHRFLDQDEAPDIMKARRKYLERICRRFDELDGELVDRIIFYPTIDEIRKSHSSKNRDG
jgi:hypothetical protein